MANYKRKEVKRTEEGFYICDRCGGYFEEDEMTRGRYGITSLCKKCTGEAHKKGAQNRAKRLNDANQELQDLRIEVAELKRQIRETANDALKRATPRELMIELHNRGYNGELEYTKVTTVDISKLE